MCISQYKWQKFVSLQIKKKKNRRYPTENNIKLRKAEELEKLQRGEVIKQNSNVQMRTKKTENTREKKRKPRKRRTFEVNINYICTDDTLYRGLRPFAGISKLYYENIFVSYKYNLL